MDVTKAGQRRALERALPYAEAHCQFCGRKGRLRLAGARPASAQCSWCGGLFLVTGRLVLSRQGAGERWVASDLCLTPVA